MKNILFISNGHGEDQIASKLISDFDYKKTWNVYCAPLVGLGNPYKSLSFVEILGPQKEMPSGGFLKGLLVILKDIRAGLLKLHYLQVINLRNKGIFFDKVVVVGDLFPLIIAKYFTKHKDIYFLPTAKSDKFEKHFIIENIFIRKYCKKVFVRDAVTEKSFKNIMINAEFLGNVMIDSFPDGEFKNNGSKKIISLLPGSRNEAYDNFKLLYQVVCKLGDNYDYVVCHAPGFDISKFKRIDTDAFLKYSTAFKTVVMASSLVIGLAGTANEQVIALGKRLVTFPGYGPQTSKKRFIQQKQLLDDLPVFIDSQNPDKIAREIEDIIKENRYVEIVANKGPKIFGETGGAAKIIQEIMS